MPQSLKYPPWIMKGVSTLFCICMLFFALCCDRVAAQDLDASALKAAYIFNFTKFIQWPETAVPAGSEPYHIVVFGDDSVEAQLKAIGGKGDGKRTIQVHHSALQSLETEDAFSQCHMVFIGSQISESESQRILDHIDGKPILSIGESRNFTRMGGIVKFFTKDDRLYFEVNVTAARAKALKFSSRLLRLAVIVDGEQ